MIGLAVTVIGLLANHYNLGWSSDGINQAINTGIEAVGIVFAAYGRFRAEGPITHLGLTPSK